MSEDDISLSDSIEAFNIDDSYLKNVDFVATTPKAYIKKNTYQNIEYKSAEQDFIITDCCSSAKSSYLSLISTIITLFILIIMIIILFVAKQKHRLNIVDRSILIINKAGSYVIWVCHCGSLLALPWLFIYLNRNTHSLYIFSAPVMMTLNLIGGILSIHYSYIPIIIELIIVSIIIYTYPFNSSYPIKKVETSLFFKGEITLMALGFIFISASLGTSTFSYIIFAPHLRFYGYNTFYPNPHYGVQYVNYLYQTQEIGSVTGGYLACFSLFMCLSVTYGFIMSFRNSLFMMIPFFILAVSTFLNEPILGVILFIQLVIHVIYYILLQTEKTRRFLAGVCIRCFPKNCNVTASTIFFGDIITFSVVIFPIIGFSNRDYRPKFPWDLYFAGTIPMMFGLMYHSFLFYEKNKDRVTDIILGPIFIEIGTYIMGFYLGGNISFNRSFTYILTYLSWSIMLSLWGRMNGFSPVLFKIYHILIPIISLALIIIYEGLGWLEIVFCFVQVFCNSFVITYVQFFTKMPVAWAFIFTGGLVAFGIISGAIATAFFVIWYFISTFLRPMRYCGFDDVFDYFVDDNSGQCDGVKWQKGEL